MKLRQAPQDFMVEEISDIKASEDDQGFGIYLLEKRGLDTFTLLAYLSKRLGVPYKDFGIAGLKDRHAITKQYITIPSSHKVGSLEEENFRLEHLGYVARPIEPGDLVANRFEITVRDLQGVDLQGIPERARDAQAFGFPNYFDSQRFGSVIGREFIAKYVIKGNYEKAVRIFLTSYTHSEKASIKADKRAILEHWGYFSNIKVSDKVLGRVVDEYTTTKDWSRTFCRIPRNLREMFFSAYQSYIWNECVKGVLVRYVRWGGLYYVNYSLGELFFYKRLNQREAEGIPRTFKTVSPKLKPSSKYEEFTVNEVLRREELTLKDLDIKKRTGHYFKTYDRDIIMKPDGFSIKDPVKDELNDRSTKDGKPRFKVTLTFTLPKGCYATVLTKRIFKR